MAYPQHPGLGSMYPSYNTAPQQYTRQTPLPPPQSLLIPPNLPPQTHLSHPYQQPQYGMPSATPTDTPQTPGQDEEAEKAEERANRSRPDIEPISKRHNGRAYVLKVMQQPQRARMCGFGDKDRRPISPPPCIMLCIYDLSTNPPVEIDYTKIDDLSRFVVMVDLACVDNLREANIVTHPHNSTSSSPSIGGVTMSAFPPTQTGAFPARGNIQSYPISNLPEYQTNQYQPPPMSGQPRQGQPFWGNGAMNYDSTRQHPSYAYQGHTPYTPTYAPTTRAYAPSHHRESVDGSRNQAAAGTLSRNLIGSLSASAFKLIDDQKRTGLWFVFQDLSIRTEGWFRLKFTFFDLKDHVPPEAANTANLSKFAPMLAYVYSKPFKVYSAKKFPGVISSTKLSKMFADQGIKIPIRKDNEGKRKRKGSDEDEEGSDEGGD